MSDHTSQASFPVQERIAPAPAASNGNGQPKVKRAKPKAPPQKSKANRVLTTDRITSSKQFEILRAYAIASDGGTTPVTNEDVAKLVKMQASTVAMTNAFFTANGFLQRADAGYLPGPEVISFDRAFQWGNAESAPFKLAPLVERTWFMSALLPPLRFRGTIDEREALELLAAESGAAPHHRKQLLMLLEYGAAVGLLERENGTVKIKQGVTPSSPQSESPESAVAPQPVSAAAPVANSPLASALFPSSASGAVHFNISVQVNMEELAGWTPDRIGSFFAGVAQVLAARGKERDDQE